MSESIGGLLACAKYQKQNNVEERCNLEATLDSELDSLLLQRFTYAAGADTCGRSTRHATETPSPYEPLYLFLMLPGGSRCSAVRCLTMQCLPPWR